MKISLPRPDDWHLHLRDGAALADTVPHSARQFARAIIMPNLKPPVTTVAQAAAYRQQILAAVPAGNDFQPLMTLYLTGETSIEEIERAAASEMIAAVKFYPAGATTNSAAGVHDLTTVYPVLEKMAQVGLPLLIHGEVTDSDVDIFDREAVFIETTLRPLMAAIPKLRIVFEHITTKEAAEFVANGPDTIAATLTPQHLLYNRNELFKGGIRPHFYCLPILKAEQHRQALIDAATGVQAHKFFLGTDSAPHAIGAKESDCGCAGIFSAPIALELYAEAFEDANALDKLPAFASTNGPAFYGLPVNDTQITLVRETQTVAADYALGTARVKPLRAGSTTRWRYEP